MLERDVDSFVCLAQLRAIHSKVISNENLSQASHP